MFFYVRNKKKIVIIQSNLNINKNLNIWFDFQLSLFSLHDSQSSNKCFWISNFNYYFIAFNFYLSIELNAIYPQHDVLKNGRVLITVYANQIFTTYDMVLASEKESLLNFKNIIKQ